MRTSSHFSQSVARHHRISWRQLAIAVLMVGALLASVSCAGKPDNKIENSFVISYAGAASRLGELEPAEAQEQLRDWARIGLASHLELDTARFRNAAYDTVPVRDAAFADLSRQTTGPGRALFDGRGVLHVLVPRGDPHEDRTIGLLIDQHRVDAGADPTQVQIHHYQIRPATQTIELTAEKPAPTSEVRSAHGFVMMRVDQRQGLTDFLAKTRHLSWLEVRGSEIWAGGWDWPDVPTVPLSVEDVSAIQRGYLQPSSARTPGFSLDPGPPETRDDILAVIPDLRPELADRLISQNWNGSTYKSADDLATVVDRAVFSTDPLPAAALAKVGLPSDRSQLWALYLFLHGREIYGQARYDGQLEGTDVGMTLFYTDYVAKHWTYSGLGTGVPTKAVEGFISNSTAVTPWSHCAGAEGSKIESGRLWFGQDDSGFAYGPDRVSIGAQATRLFSRSDSNGGTEVEPSFQAGRGMRWWDRHYQAVADYEPQYRRLDEIMRWSGALDWLTSKTQARLPQLDSAAIRSNLRFKDWYAQHNELRERSPIEFVTPPSAQHAAVRTKPSKVHEDCGFVFVYGGVSLGNLLEREGGRNFHANLPQPVRRAGLFDKTSHVDLATGTGRIGQVSIDDAGRIVDSVQRTLSTTLDGHAVVDTVATGRLVAPFGKLKVWRADTATRQVKVGMAAARGQISMRVEFLGQRLGELTAQKEADVVTIQWQRGLVDRVRRALETIQDRLVSQPSTELPTASDGVLYSYQDGGQVWYRVGGPGDPWLSITKELTPPGDELVFRLGGPDPRTGEPEFFLGKLSQPPKLPPDWMEVTPAAKDHPAKVVAAVPPPDARTVRVSTPEGTTTTIAQIGNRVLARVDDPIVGINGTVAGAALLRDFPRVADAMRDAAQAHDGLLRGVRLDGDGVALAGPDTVIVVAADHPWAQRVLRAFGPGPSQQVPLIRIEAGNALVVDPSPLTKVPGSGQRMALGDVLDNPAGDVYVHEKLRSMLLHANGALVADVLPRDTKVTVRAARPSAESAASQPDIRVHAGAQWWRVGGIGAGPGSGAVPAVSGQILLVCPDTDENLPGCEQ